MNKSDFFTDQQRELARFSRVVSHPARLAILRFLADAGSPVSGDISDSLPLSRSTVSQHLKDLRNTGLIKGEADGLKINYRLCTGEINRYRQLFNLFFDSIFPADINNEDTVNDNPESETADPVVFPEPVSLNEEPWRNDDIFFF